MANQAFAMAANVFSSRMVLLDQADCFLLADPQGFDRLTAAGKGEKNSNKNDSAYARDQDCSEDTT